MRILFSLLFLLLPLHALALVEGDLLAPEQAFKFSARVAEPGHVEVSYQIADGYYLYRDKFKFSAEPAPVVLGPPAFPAGKIKQDDYFGKVETYRHEIKIDIPYTLSDPAVRTMTLKATAQGCADAGVCYPPMPQTVSLQLPPPAPTPPAPPAATALAPLSNLGASADNEFLPPDLAFGLTVSVKDANTLTADFKPAPSYYLYRDRVHFSLRDSAGISIAKVVLPPGETKNDPNFGQTVVYHHPFQAQIVLQREDPARTALTLVAGYQGCSEKGVCYPPIEKTFALKLPPAAPSAQAGPAAPATATEQAAAPASGSATESSRIAALFQGGNFWLIVAFFFGAGLLLAFTPCVFPMIPILSGIIVGQGSQITKGRSFLLSFAYVQGMALTYAVAGTLAGWSGTMFTAALQNPWVLGAFALVFVALALSMFGLYELQLPSFLQSKFSNASNRMKGGSLVGVVVMGALSALIVGPCVAPPLFAALVYIGQSHDLLLGGSALYAMGLGMGAPLILVGLSAGTLLPKAGPWMTAVKGFFGVLLLAVAIWLVSPVIPTVAVMLLWAALLIISAMYLRAADPLPPNARGAVRLWKGVGVIALIVGAALLVGALSGGRDILQPLAGLRASSAVQGNEAPALKFERVASVAALEQRLAASRGRYVMLDFYADWCVSCKEFERFTFSDPRVAAKLKDAVLLQADVTADNADDKALLRKFGLFGPPGIIFFDPKGQEITSARTVGYTPPEQFLATLDRVFGQPAGGGS